MKYYSIEFSILDSSNNWQVVADTQFEAKHYTKAEQIAENSKWANALRAKYPGRKYYIGWKGES